jgi:hypothetical protein
MASHVALSHDSSHNRPTRYEVAVVIDGETTVVGYTARKTKASLLAVGMDNAKEMLLAALPADDQSSPTYSSREGWALGPCRICFTGATEKHPTPLSE